MNAHVPVLMYHSIKARPPRGTAALAVSPGAFADQMALLAERGFTPVPFSALGGPGLPGKPIVITFDDGYADFHEHALPVLERHGFPATVFVTTGWLADAGPDAAGRPLDTMMAWSQVREAAAHGVEVGGHSHSHPQLDQLGDAALREELIRNKGLLEERLGGPVTTMAYPFGYSSARVRRAVRAAGYDSACAVANRLAPAPDGGAARADVLAIPRLTVRMSTSLATFGRVADGRGVPLVFLKDHLLTRGYAVVRRARYGARRAARRV
ncbi:polysaccharide deacetylase family protein [Actinomadura hibisca]|uniref:polysaccharide deacetylase family protein n=1 Tax=Actinomadura hibisca TaxID=68565 RepID=UPI00082B5540|nr:polysaccharide deacetylase family protein [Actinomadura hibisca]